MLRIALLLALAMGAECASHLTSFDTFVQQKVQSLTLAQKVSEIQGNIRSIEHCCAWQIGQMTQIDMSQVGWVDGTTGDWVFNETNLDILANRYFVGSYLNTPLSGGPIGGRSALNVTQWQAIIRRLQDVSMNSDSETPMIFGLDSVHGANYVQNATLFPQQINAAASFNVQLTRQMGAITAKDTRATGIPWTFSPILGIAVQPSWPRVYETFGEDPYLVGQMGQAIIEGYQCGNPPDLQNRSCVAACMKHFVGYPDPRSGHDRAPSWISDRTLRQYFLPPFGDAVKAGVATAMESYNSINMEPVAASRHYLSDMLRDEISFQGMLVTDWAEIKNLHDWHRIVPDQQSGVKLAMEQTTIDMSMVPTDTTFADHLLALVQGGHISEERLDVSVARILQLKSDLGLFDEPYGYDPGLAATIGQPADRAAALAMARESIVLLKNEGNLLPLSLQPPQPRNILLTGPSCNSLRYLSGGWSIHWQGAQDNEFWAGSTILQGISKVIADHSADYAVTYIPGVTIDGTQTAEYRQMLDAARTADVVVACIGEDAYAEKPGDIAELALAWGQRRLLLDLTNSTRPGALAVILLEGRPRVLHGAMDGAAAQLHGMLPGPEGGQAIAEILFGLGNPSGRLPYSYPAHTNDALTPYWRPNSQQPYAPAYEFGWGLSYTTFAYSALTITPNEITSANRNEPVTVSVQVQNTGTRVGSHSVLLFISDLYRIISPEVKILKRFTKISNLGAGQSTTVNFQLTVNDLAFYGLDAARGTQLEDGDFVFTIGVGSSAQSAPFKLSVGAVSIPEAPTPAAPSRGLIHSWSELSVVCAGFFLLGALAHMIIALFYRRRKRPRSAPANEGDALLAGQ